MLSEGVVSFEVSFSALADCLVKGGELAKAEGWLQMMKDLGVLPGLATQTRLEYACAKAGQAGKAEA